MNTIIDEMLAKYDVVTLDDRKNVMKEIIQEIVLCGLSRARFFSKAAFYGGTALRIFYGLDRFSEDLDFSLKESDENFDLEAYFPLLQKEVESYGLRFSVEEKKKTVDSHVKSAFLKGNTREHMLLFYSDQDLVKGICASELLKVKFEVDIFPPSGATYESRFSLSPSPYEVLLYDLPSLFAGKTHAILCRGWKNRVKGRDLYDFVFYMKKRAPLNLENLRQKLIQSGVIASDAAFSLDDVKSMLNEKFDSIDYENAKMDVRNFIKDERSLDVWSPAFFKAIVADLRC